MHKAVKVKDFAEQVALLNAESKAKLVEEFDSIATDAPFTQHAAKLLCNQAKNRYTNIIPCKFFNCIIKVSHIRVLFQMTIQGWC